VGEGAAVRRARGTCPAFSLGLYPLCQRPTSVPVGEGGGVSQLVGRLYARRRGLPPTGCRRRRTTAEGAGQVYRAH